VSEKGCGRVALLSGRTITLAMGVLACPREHHGALGARVSRILSRLRRSDHLTAILIGVGSGVFIIAAGRIFRQIIVVHTASAANRRLVSTADSRYLALILVRLVCTGHDANTLYCTRFLPWSAERNDLLPDLDRSGCISARSTCGYSGIFLALWNGTLRVPACVGISSVGNDVTLYRSAGILPAAALPGWDALVQMGSEHRCTVYDQGETIRAHSESVAGICRA